MESGRRASCGMGLVAPGAPQSKEKKDINFKSPGLSPPTPFHACSLFFSLFLSPYASWWVRPVALRVFW